MSQQDHVIARRLMIERYLKPNGISDQAVLQAFADVPRHEFVSVRQQREAYLNKNLSIGFEQTMLAPLVLAKILEALKMSGTEDVLEVGTGSGYLTALLMTLGRYVFSLERIPQLAEKAANNLQGLNYHNVDLHIGDGSQGLADMASFDVIVITAHVPKIPKPLALQLDPLRGRMLIPIGDSKQQKLKLIRREGNRWYARSLGVINVPALIGRYGTTPPSVTV